MPSDDTKPGLPSADDEMVPTDAQRSREACAVAVEEASRHRGWARRWKALAKRLVRWRWLTERDSEEVWSDCRAAYAQIAELERDLTAERTRYAELLERWRGEQRRRIAAEHWGDVRAMGGHLAIVALLALIRQALDMHVTRSRLEWQLGNREAHRAADEHARALKMLLDDIEVAMHGGAYA